MARQHMRAIAITELPGSSQADPHRLVGLTCSAGNRVVGQYSAKNSLAVHDQRAIGTTPYLPGVSLVKLQKRGASCESSVASRGQHQANLAGPVPELGPEVIQELPVTSRQLVVGCGRTHLRQVVRVRSYLGGLRTGHGLGHYRGHLLVQCNRDAEALGSKYCAVCRLRRRCSKTGLAKAGMSAANCADTASSTAMCEPFWICCRIWPAR